jgi:molybdopterin converting factor small subunit
MLQARLGRHLTIEEPVSDVATLIAAIDRRFPGIAAELDDPIFNVAVNDEMLLHAVHSHRLEDGDVIEFVPAIAGG